MPMNSKTNDNGHNDIGNEQVAVSSTAFLQWHVVLLVGMCIFLTLVTAEVEGQTTSSSPVPPIATGVAQPVPVPQRRACASER